MHWHTCVDLYVAPHKPHCVPHTVVSPQGAEETLLRRDLPAGEGRPRRSASSGPQGSQASLRCPCRRGEEVPRRLTPARRGQVQRDIPHLLLLLQLLLLLFLQAQPGHLGPTSAGHPPARWAVGVTSTAAPPRENPEQRSPANATEVAPVGSPDGPSPEPPSLFPMSSSPPATHPPNSTPQMC